MNIKAVVALLICLLMQGGAIVSAQHTELKWLRGWFGGGDNKNNRMDALAVDDEGNTYVAGAINISALSLDRTIATPENDSMPACQTHGVIVAKYDTVGNLIWRKVCRSTLDGMQSFMRVEGMELSGNRLYLLMEYFLETDGLNPYITCPLELWFFDTVYSWPFDHVNNPNPNHFLRWTIPDSLRRFPFNNWNGGRYSVFVVFDLDGNRLENHSIYLKRPNRPYNTVLKCPFVVDSKKNIWCFCPGGTDDLGCENIPTGWAYIIDDDTSNVLTLDEIFGCSGNGYDTVPSFNHLIKIDSNWNVVGGKRMTYRLDTRQLRPAWYADTTSYNWVTMGIVISGVSIDEEDNMYMRACIRSTENFYAFYNDTLDVDYPYRLYFDSTHYVRVDNFVASQGIPINAKYDSDGNLLWLNQMYLQTEDMKFGACYAAMSDFEGEVLANRTTKLTWDSSYVYNKLTLYEDWQPLWYLMNWSLDNRPWHPHNWYLDSNYTMQVTMPDSHAAMESMRLAGHPLFHWPFFVMVYDRETGEPVRYFNPLDDIPPLEVWEVSNARWGKILTTDDDLLIGCTRSDQHGSGYTHRYLLRYNKSSGVTTVLDSNCAYAAHLLENLHPDGWLIGREAIAESSYQIPNLPDGTTNAVYASCYYLPDFDRRRHVVVECAPVEEVRVTHVVESDVTLAWRGGANHVVWQAAYLPADAATDSTAWEHALLVETTDTTLTLPLDTCCLLRVRGICDAENCGPWSEPVEACPQPHIGIGTVARQPSGPTLTPNPATEAVTVVDGATGVAERQVIELEVISPLGQTVMHLKGVSRFNVADLASGTYMVKIRTPRGTTLWKLTVR